MLRERPDGYTPAVERLVGRDGLFGGLEVGGGSIGVMFARLWKGEVGATVLEPNYDTPWDSAPILGISRRMGFGVYRVTPAGLDEVVPRIAKVPVERKDEWVVVHKSRADELRAWFADSQSS